MGCLPLLAKACVKSIASKPEPKSGPSIRSTESENCVPNLAGPHLCGCADFPRATMGGAKFDADDLMIPESVGVADGTAPSAQRATCPATAYTGLRGGVPWGMRRARHPGRRRSPSARGRSAGRTDQLEQEVAAHVQDLLRERRFDGGWIFWHIRTIHTHGRA